MKKKYPKTKPNYRKLTKKKHKVYYTKPQNINNKIKALKLVYNKFGYIKREIFDKGKS